MQITTSYEIGTLVTTEKGAGVIYQIELRVTADAVTEIFYCVIDNQLLSFRANDLALLGQSKSATT
jgi:hypothetical protein